MRQPLTLSGPPLRDLLLICPQRLPRSRVAGPGPSEVSAVRLRPLDRITSPTRTAGTRAYGPQKQHLLYLCGIRSNLRRYRKDRSSYMTIGWAGVLTPEKWQSYLSLRFLPPCIFSGVRAEWLDSFTKFNRLKSMSIIRLG